MFFNTTSFIVIILIFSFSKDIRVHAILEKNEESKSELLNIKSNNTCTSPKCVSESKFFLDNMDRSIDPCSDFFSFACGGFLKNTLIPEDEFLVSQYGKINKKIQEDLITKLKSGQQITDLEAFKKIKNFFTNCVNETRIENDGRTPILELFEKLGGWPVVMGNEWKEDSYRWENTVSLISKAGLLPDFPFKIDVIYDTNLTKYIIDVRGAELEVDNSYNMTDKNSKHYINFMTYVAVALGANKETVFNEMKECLEFELKLFKALYSIDETTIDLLTAKKKSIKLWAIDFPDIPWLSLFNKVFNPSNVSVTENDILLIHESQYVSKLWKLLNNTTKRTLANHQIWSIFYYYIIKFTPKEFRAKYENFKELILEKDKALPRENECFNFLQQHAPVALNSLYIQKFINRNGKSEQLNILKNVKNGTKSYFEKLEWMDEDIRRFALEKLETLSALIDYPDELLNNTKVEEFYEDSSVNLGSSLYSYLNITKAEKNYSLRMLRYPQKENDWAKNTRVASVTANYDSDNHRISIATGMLHSPFFDPDRPKYLNYGGLGFAIGHEIIHGIDTTDGQQNYAIVWKNSTIEEYTKRAKCIMDQFSNYTISEIMTSQLDNKTYKVSVNVDGERTYMENIADGGGFKLGYYAYNNWIRSNNLTEPLLPGLNFTPQQMYWISTASCLCSKTNKTVPLSFDTRDVHSPDEARINVGFSNVIEFAKDFKCPVGSRMNPVQKCIVW